MLSAFEVRVSPMTDSNYLAIVLISQRYSAINRLSSAMKCGVWYPRQGSNLRPFAPEANALIH